MNEHKEEGTKGMEGTDVGMKGGGTKQMEGTKSGMKERMVE
jgi:hypothetical protein